MSNLFRPSRNTPSFIEALPLIVFATPYFRPRIRLLSQQRLAPLSNKEILAAVTLLLLQEMNSSSKIPLILLAAVLYHRSQSPPATSEVTVTVEEQKKASGAAPIPLGERLIPYAAPMGNVSSYSNNPRTYLLKSLCRLYTGSWLLQR